MISRRAPIAAAAAVLMGAVGACGGGPPALAVPDLVAKINAICTSYAHQVEAVAVPSFTPRSASAAGLGAAARYLHRAVPLLQSEQRSIKAAGTPKPGTPKSGESLYHSMLSALAAHVHDEQAARAAAQAHNLRSFKAALRADQTDSTRLSGTAQQFGVTACVGG